MIRLTNQNWWVRMTYTLRPSWQIPERTNICSLFWRGVAVLGAEVLFATFVGYAVAAGIVHYDILAQVGLVLLFAVALFGAMFFVAYLVIRGTLMGKEGIARLAETVPAQAFKSWKERHCALVRIEQTEREWM